MPDILQNSVFLSHDVTKAHKLIDILSQKLMARGHLLATAESCTGGLIAALCTDMPGSSAWFCGSVVAYANSVKERLLGVSPETLEAHGAVSQEVVTAMALGALENVSAQCAIAVSGIAGPDGGTSEKPVGTVWVAVAAPSGAPGAKSPPESVSRCFLFGGNRAEIRMAAAVAGLEMLLERLEE